MIKTRFCKWDMLPVAIVLALAAVAFLLFLPAKTPASRAEVYQNGKLLTTLPLDRDSTYTVTGAYTNTITVKNGQVAVTESDCPGEDCKACGFTGTSGKSIVCLPNGLEIRIVGKSTDVDFVVR